MIIKSVEQTRLGFNTSKWWKVSFTSNSIREEHGAIIQAMAGDPESVIPIIRQLERENGYFVEPLTGKTVEILEGIISYRELSKIK